MKNCSLLYPHRHAQPGAGAGLAHPCREGERGRGSGATGSGLRVRGSAARRGEPFPQPPSIGVSAAEHQLLPKTPLAAGSAGRSHAWPGFIPHRSGFGSPWVPTAPGKDGAILPLGVTQPLKPPESSSSGLTRRQEQRARIPQPIVASSGRCAGRVCCLREPSGFVHSSGNFANINFLSFDDPFNIK